MCPWTSWRSGAGDLLVLGFEGPAIGEILEALLEEVIEERLPNDRAVLLEYARRRRMETRIRREG